MTNIPYSVLGINATIKYFPEILKDKIVYCNMTKYICNNDLKCPYIKNNLHVYKDYNHLNLFFSKSISEQLLTQFIKIKPIGNALNKVYQKCWIRGSKYSL